MAAAVPFIMAASAAIGAVGAIRSAQATSAAASYNSSIASQNATITNAQGAAAAEAQGRDAQRRIGAAVAAFGGSGVQGSTGSPTDVMADNIQSATLDNLTTQYNYKLRAMGYSQQASLDSANASNASTSGYLSAAGQLTSGLAGAYYKANGSQGGYQIPTYGSSSTYGFGG